MFKIALYIVFERKHMNMIILSFLASLLWCNNYLYSQNDCEFDFGNIDEKVFGLNFGASIESAQKHLKMLGFHDLKISDEDEKGQIIITTFIEKPRDCYPKTVNFIFYHKKFFGADISLYIASKHDDKEMEAKYIKSIYYQLSKDLMMKINKPYNTLLPDDIRKKVEDYMYIWYYTEGDVTRLILISQIFPNTIQFQNFKFEGDMAKGIDQLMKILLKIK
jgi:hypothetical protein